MGLLKKSEVPMQLAPRNNGKVSVLPSCSTNAPSLNGSRVKKQRPVYANEKHPINLWNGWYVDGEVLVDGGGNFYRQSEIRAIFYTRQLLKSLREEIDFLKPRPLCEPIQLSLPGVGSFFDHMRRQTTDDTKQIRSNEECV